MAKARLSWGVSKWDLFVLQHYDWQVAAVAKHNAFLAALEQDPESPVIIHEHLLWLLTTVGSPLCSTVMAFAQAFEEAYRADWDQLPTAECRQKLERAKMDMVEFEHALVEYCTDRLFSGIDTMTGEAFLPMLVAREVQSRAYDCLRAMYRALHKARDEQLNLLIESSMEPAFAAVIPLDYRRDFRSVADILSHLPVYTHTDAKLCCVVDALKDIHTCLDRPPATSADFENLHASPAHIHGVQGTADVQGPLNPGDPNRPPPSEAEQAAGDEEGPGRSLGADVMLPIFIYCLLGSQVPCLWSEAEFLQDFIKETQSRGHYGYCLVTLQSALVFLLQRAGGGPIGWGFRLP